MYKITKGHKFVKTRVELQLFFSAHRLKILYICTKFCENILNGFKVIERTPFSYKKKKKNTKGHNFANDKGGGTILFLCTLSEYALYVYQIS